LGNQTRNSIGHVLGKVLSSPMWSLIQNYGASCAASFPTLSGKKLRESSLVLFAVGVTCCPRNRSRNSVRRIGTVPYWPRNHLGGSGRLGWSRLLAERSILRQGPLQNRWNRLSTSRLSRCVECAFDHPVRLEPILARFYRHSGWKLRPRVDLEEVLMRRGMAGVDDVRNYPGWGPEG
jgi:hypothetical protein